MRYMPIEKVIAVQFYDNTVPPYKRTAMYVRVGDLVQLELRGGVIEFGRVTELWKDHMSLAGRGTPVYFWQIDDVLNVEREIDNAY